MPLRFFVRGEPYKLFWIIPTNVHLFGVEGPKRAYLLGTDQFGRDYLSRLLYASQISLSVGLIGIAITFALGLLVGGTSGYYGGRVDDVIMRLCEVVMSVPSFYLLLTLAALLPKDLPPALVYVMIIAILSLVGWAGMARVVRGMVLSVREREYVEAARALGVGDLKIIVRHILPSTLTYAIVAATLSIPAYILGEASLSFLSLGIREPMPSWGNMLSAAQNLEVLEKNTWILAPGLAIFLTTLAFNFLGDGLRDALDPKTK
jgi:peptide/nickel transport system permease protein